MVTRNYSTPWEEAVKRSFLHLRVTRQLRTAKTYRAYIRQLADWATAERIEITVFTQRHLVAYLAHRKDLGRSDTMVCHDALYATIHLPNDRLLKKRGFLRYANRHRRSSLY